MTASMQPLTPAEVNRITDAFYGAIEAGDINAVAASFTEDFRLWLAGGAGNQDKSGTVKIINRLISVTNDRHYDVLDRQQFDGGLVQQHLLHGTIHDGTPFSVRVAVIMRIGAEGLFTKVDEYVDVTEMGALGKKDLPRK